MGWHGAKVETKGYGIIVRVEGMKGDSEFNTTTGKLIKGKYIREYKFIATKKKRGWVTMLMNTRPRNDEGRKKGGKQMLQSRMPAFRKLIKTHKRLKRMLASVHSTMQNGVNPVHLCLFCIV